MAQLTVAPAAPAGNAPGSADEQGENGEYRVGDQWYTAQGQPFDARARAASGGSPGGASGSGSLSDEEKALFEALTGILTTQGEHLKNQTQLFADLMPSYKDLFLTQNAYGTEATNYLRQILPVAYKEMLASYSELQKLSTVSDTERLATANVNAYLRGGSILTAADMGRLDTIFARVREEGTESIRQFAEESAAARGLSMTDTPIGHEALTQVRELESSLGSTRAQAELGLEQAKAQFSQASQQFGTNLRAAAVSNRLAMTTGFIPGFKGGVTGGGALPTVGSPDTGGAFSFLSGMSGQRATAGQNALEREFRASQGALDRQGRLDVANTPTPGRTPTSLDWFSAVAPVLVAGINASTARVKRAIHPLDADEYDAALSRVRATPITRYRYRWEPDQGPPHIGPILELAPPEISDDGVHVNLLDYQGLQHAALKAVDRRVTRLESGRLAPPGRRRP